MLVILILLELDLALVARAQLIGTVQLVLPYFIVGYFDLATSTSELAVETEFANHVPDLSVHISEFRKLTALRTVPVVLEPSVNALLAERSVALVTFQSRISNDP